MRFFLCTILLMFLLSTQALFSQESGVSVETGGQASSTSTADSSSGAASSTTDPASSATGAITLPLESSLASLDFSKATISLAGPAALYVRGVQYKERAISLFFRLRDDGIWAIENVYTEADQVFPVGLMFDFARLSVNEQGQLEIDGIFLDGVPYKALAQINADNSLSIPLNLEAGSLVGSSLSRARVVGALAYKDELAAGTAAQEKVSELERMNSEMLASIGSLETANAALLEEKTALEAAFAELESQNDALDIELAALKDQITALEGTITDQELEISRLTEEAAAQSANSNASSSTSTDTSSTDSSTESSVNDQLLLAIEALQTKVDALERSIGSLGTKLGAANPAALNTDAIEAEIDKLKRENAQLVSERIAIEARIRQSFLESGYIATIRPSLSQNVLKGFAQASPKIGRWNVQGQKATQTDPNAYFAQLDLPLAQDGKTLLYRFKLQSTGRDWVGAGIHLYASGSTRRGYGHGKSILVWLTRDPDHYQNRNTYLQLYRSDNDVQMGRVLDAAIQESIAQELLVEVLYQPKEEYISVAVNGVEKIRYKTFFGYNKGVEVSLRSLNTSVFSDLEVLSAP